MSNNSQTIPVVLIRHAQSLWNAENRFTGWANPPLTEQGKLEARQAADCLRVHGYLFDQIYASRLTRAIDTASLLREGIGQSELPIDLDWRLNERHYGALQGTDKTEATARADA